MARDPPSPISASSEIRDISLSPSHVRNARITIIHPQLRDLLLPLARGHVLYPKGTTVEEQEWAPDADLDEDDLKRGSGGVKYPSSGKLNTFLNLSFTPNCLTARGNVLACGGQHGELYLTTLPQSISTASSSFSSRLASLYPSSQPAKPFEISIKLPTGAINNSMTILPCWPNEWKRRVKERRDGYIGASSYAAYRDGEEDHEDDNAPSDEEDDSFEVDGSTRHGYDDGIDIDLEDLDTDVGMDSEELDDFPSPTSSAATYPNTVPIDIPSRRSASFGSYDRSQPSIARPAHAPRPAVSASLDGPNVRYIPSRASQPPSAVTDVSSVASASTSGSIKRKRRKPRLDEPRLLISNNDQTVKMFSIRYGPSSGMCGSTHPSSAFDRSPRTAQSILSEGTSFRSDRRQSVPRGPSAQEIQQDVRRYYSRIVNRPREPVPPPRPHFGSSFGFDALGMNQGISEMNQDEILQQELERARAFSRMTEENLRRERQDFERAIGMRVRPGIRGHQQYRDPQSAASSMQGSPPSQREKIEMESRRLAKVGGSRFKYAINHSSLSPDLRTMVSVGDSAGSTDVHLFEVIEGGREFKKIATYHTATDAAFSTSWSKDGRKFAVASQDGQVTVWDHRSSRPLAVFFTSATSSDQSSSPSFNTDLDNSVLQTSSRRLSRSAHHQLRDAVTGEAVSGSSNSGREAARVVKFSPEGSSRDIMVFSEQESNIHIIDAKTFNAHVVVPVPCTLPSVPTDPSYRHRIGVDSGTFGIAGVAFDPTGDWLYSGTEKTVVEWDLRRLGGGHEGGTWTMA